MNRHNKPLSFSDEVETLFQGTAFIGLHHGDFPSILGNSSHSTRQEQVYQSFLRNANTSTFDDELWFPGEQLLPVQELAARFGDAQGQRIHSYPVSIRYWWLECARRIAKLKLPPHLSP